MRCPKCQYISFENEERCRNCGYSFALSAVSDAPDLAIWEEPVVGPLMELTLRPAGPAAEVAAVVPPSTASALESPATTGPSAPAGPSDAPTPPADLPLFDEPTPSPLPPPKASVTPPRPPLAVRRSADASRPPIDTVGGQTGSATPKPLQPRTPLAAAVGPVRPASNAADPPPGDRPEAPAPPAVRPSTPPRIGVTPVAKEPGVLRAADTKPESAVGLGTAASPPAPAGATPRSTPLRREPPPPIETTQALPTAADVIVRAIPEPAPFDPFAASTDEPALPLASVGSRAFAAAIDALLFVGVAAVVLYFTAQVAGVQLGDIGRLPLGPLVGFLAILSYGYHWAFVAACGQTIGKMVAGIRVSSDDGGSLGAGRAAARAAVAVLAPATFGLVFVPAFFDGRRRASEDRVAGTVVLIA
ncbi:MAG: RDD family protein [Vicinamibacterales bacterium]